MNCSNGGLSDFRDKAIVTYSKGMLQRIGLAQALLISRPVFLDETDLRLDPVADPGAGYNRELRTRYCVFLNSHLLSEIESLATGWPLSATGK